MVADSRKMSNGIFETKLIKSNNKPSSLLEIWRDLNQIKRKLGLQPSATVVSLQRKDNPQKP